MKEEIKIIIKSNILQIVRWRRKMIGIIAPHFNTQIKIEYIKEEKINQIWQMKKKIS